MLPELLTSVGAMAVWSAFGPVLTDLAKEVAKDMAKNYVIRCFGNVFSPSTREPLTKAVLQTVKVLLDLLEYELGLDEEMDQDELIRLRRAATAFLEQEAVRETIRSLLLEPLFHADPADLARAWDQLHEAPLLPEDFSWSRISKKFSSTTRKIRDDSVEIRTALQQTASIQANEAILGHLGPQPDLDLDKYKKALLDRFGRLNLECLDADGGAYDAVRLWNVFEPQSVRECGQYRPQLLELPKEEQQRLIERGEIDAHELREQERLRQEYFRQSPRPALEVCADKGLLRLALLGDPGSGKSTLLRWLAVEWARAKDPSALPLPLLVELRHYSQWECSSGKSFPAYFHHASPLHRLNQQQLDRLLRTPGRTILLLDGLDEIFDPQQREQVADDVFRFSNEHPQTKVILTSRVVGYKAQQLLNAGFRHCMLQDFDQNQIGAFLQRWHEVVLVGNVENAERKQRRLLKAIEESRPIALLAGNPLLLTLMAIVNRHQDLPRNRACLYEKAAELLLQQWDTERHLRNFPGLSAEIDLRAKTAILRKVALAMQTAGSKAANSISGERLTELIEKNLHDELRFAQARAAANALVEHLRQRNFILCSLGGDCYGFVHRTFLEHFCAAEYVHQFRDKQTLKLEDLLVLFDARCCRDDWQEVLRLICGQLDESFASRIVAHLAAKADMDAWDGRSPLPELELAVWCLSEVRNLNRIDADTGAALIRKTVRCLLEQRMADREIRSSIPRLVEAAAAIGPNWPGKETFQFAGQYPKISKGNAVDKTSCQEYWPLFLAVVFMERAWLEQLSQVDDQAIRAGCCSALATYWPDDQTRQMLVQRAQEDKDQWPRWIVLQHLATHWPDDQTRQLIVRRAQEDKDLLPRGVALQQLARHWPNDQTRQMLVQRAKEDEDLLPRSTALEQLATHWPDDQTRKMLVQRAQEDEDLLPRSTALEQLATHWPDDQTRQMLVRRAQKDKDSEPRSTALELLAKFWPDDQTRKMLVRRAQKDKDSEPRSTALELLTEHWPDDQARQLIVQRAQEDKDFGTRSTALELLTEHWPDDQTHQLIVQRAQKDKDDWPRRTALQLLATHWPDDRMQAGSLPR